MKLPEYVTAEEVRRVCKELKIRDWSRLEDIKIPPREAKIILKEVNTGRMKISIDDFCAGLEVELEHGTRFKDANVTNNHPVLTGKIVLAHLKESPDYYKRLAVAELEGDLLKALIAKKPARIESKLKKLVEARRILNHAESKQLKSL